MEWHRLNEHPDTDQVPGFYQGDTGLIPGDFYWDSWWTNWHWSMFLPDHRFPLLIITATSFHNHSSRHHKLCDGSHWLLKLRNFGSQLRNVTCGLPLGWSQSCGGLLWHRLRKEIIFIVYFFTIAITHRSLVMDTNYMDFVKQYCITSS
jgi:hypothetical protein